MTILQLLQDCYIRLETQKLIVGNASIERSWSLAEGVPVNLTLTDKRNGKEWLRKEQQGALFASPWLPPIADLESVFLSSSVDNDLGVSESCLQAHLDLHYTNQDWFVRLCILIYPNQPFIRHHLKALSSDTSTNSGHIRIEPLRQYAAAESESVAAMTLDNNNKQAAEAGIDYLDRLPLSDLHCRWESVIFRDQTDVNNNLISRDQGLLYRNERRSLRGNLLILQNNLSDNGLLLIKEGATPTGHQNDTGADFDFHGVQLRMIGSGVGVSDTLAGQSITSYGATVGVMSGDRYEHYQLLQRYHRTIKRHQPQKDSYLLSNTWGDRSRDGRVTEAFLLKELEAAAKLGIAILQIDDGWQKGVTSNSVHAAKAGGRWGDYYSGGGDFWEVHPERFPRGLAPVIEKASKLGIKLGLWYSPDSAQDCVHWKKDRDTLIRMHREWGITVFKLDGVNLTSKLAEERLLKMIRGVVEASGGAVDFNMDTTAQKRLGYWNSVQYGNLFLENRYTDWRSYYPHWTLRNLWLLSPYMPTSKLQMEFLNVNRNTELYEDDPLAPSACGQVYAFATVAFANPLAWMELSSLSDGQMNALTQAIHAWKPHHDRILAGHVLPIGEEPTGVGWTGFQSIADARSGYLLIMRELHPSEEFAMKLWGLGAGSTESSVSERAAAIRLTEIVRMDEKDIVHAGAGKHDGDEGGSEIGTQLLPPNANGTYSFRRPAPFTFTIYRYEIQ
ncbi:alpha-galactosidase [Paenibacillus sp. HB172176]|uniref:alpha-galactosidase n=1 Tax=Paenibacillus sp. HB172176 TaxID=2493690 RepID=UPI00143AA3E2|nr:alpha-galactosidase [Paenibacillus sp. HB172176]